MHWEKDTFVSAVHIYAHEVNLTFTRVLIIFPLVTVCMCYLLHVCYLSVGEDNQGLLYTHVLCTFATVHTYIYGIWRIDRVYLNVYVYDICSTYIIHIIILVTSLDLKQVQIIKGKCCNIYNLKLLTVFCLQLYQVNC